jgi:hypothetical protein
MADVNKDLSIRVSAEDTTAGTWGKLTDSTQAALNWMTPLNQAWELGAKLWGKIQQAGTAAIDALSRGGDLNETTAAFDRLTLSTGLGGPAMVKALQDVTVGVMGIDDAMKLASTSMQRGFSADQVSTIATFAKRYSEATGQSLTTVMESIEKAILTGRRLEQLEMFGISIQKGQEMSSVLAEIERATAKLGEGAFSFADIWKGSGQKVADVLDVIAREMNRLMSGEVEGMATRFRDAMDDIANEAPAIAAALWIPIREIGSAVDWLIGGFDNIGTSVVTFALGAGNTFFELTKLLGTLGQTVAWTMDKFYAMNETIAWARGNTSRVEYIQAQRKAWEEYGNSFSEVDRAQKEFNDTILNSRTLDEAAMETRKKSRITVDELALGIQKVGGATKELSEETKKLTAEEKKVNSEYQRRIDLYKSLGIGYQKVAGGTAEEWKPMKYSQFSTGGQAGASRGGMEGSSVDIVGKDGSAQSGIIQLGAPPGDPLLNLIVDYINRAIQAEGTIGAGF